MLIQTLFDSALTHVICSCVFGLGKKKKGHHSLTSLNADLRFDSRLGKDLSELSVAWTGAWSICINKQRAPKTLGYVHTSANKGACHATNTEKKSTNFCRSLTPAEWKWAAPEGRVSQDAFNCNFSNELVTLVTDKGERLAGQVEPLGQDLVAVVRETRIFTGNGILSCRKKREEESWMDAVKFLNVNLRFCVRARLPQLTGSMLRWHDSGIISTPSSRWLRADWYGALALHLHIKHCTQTLIIK